MTRPYSDDLRQRASELVRARELPLVVICRSGRRSALAAQTMRELGYSKAVSLKLGVKGWNDSEFPLIDGRGDPVDPEKAEKMLEPEISPEQLLCLFRSLSGRANYPWWSSAGRGGEARWRRRPCGSSDIPRLCPSSLASRGGMIANFP